MLLRQSPVQPQFMVQMTVLPLHQLIQRVLGLQQETTVSDKIIPTNEVIPSRIFHQITFPQSTNCISESVEKSHRFVPC